MFSDVQKLVREKYEPQLPRVHEYDWSHCCYPLGTTSYSGWQTKITLVYVVDEIGKITIGIDQNGFYVNLKTFKTLPKVFEYIPKLIENRKKRKKSEEQPIDFVKMKKQIQEIKKSFPNAYKPPKPPPQEHVVGWRWYPEAVHDIDGTNCCIAFFNPVKSINDLSYDKANAIAMSGVIPKLETNRCVLLTRKGEPIFIEGQGSAVYYGFYEEMCTPVYFRTKLKRLLSKGTIVTI